MRNSHAIVKLKGAKLDPRKMFSHESQPSESVVPVDGQSITVWQWAGEAPAVVFCHATGFHGRCWDQIVARLPGRQCIALDFRGHGRSSKSAPPYRWRTFGDDLAAVLRHFDIRAAVGVGHSMGGHSVVHAAAILPQAFSRLVLLDPVIRARDTYTGALPELDFVLKRRNKFASPDEMFERFKNRTPFAIWDPAILRDYCNFGLLPSPNGAGFVLACPPSVEAGIYSQSCAKESDLYDEIPLVKIPVAVIRSAGEFQGDNFLASPTLPQLASFFPDANDIPLTGVTHFIPMQAPDLTADMILSEYRSWDML